MGSVYDWSTTAGSNGNSDASVNFAEGQLPPTLNNSARAVMARMAAWLKQLGAAITHGGSSNAYTLTLPTGHQITAYATGMRFLWKPNGNSSGVVTLNVDGVGAKKVFLEDGSTQATTGHILSGRLIDVVYDATLDSATGGFQVVGPSIALGAQPLDALLTAIAALTTADDRMLDFTGSDTVAVVTYATVLSNIGAQAALGYTAANDTAVVHKTGTESVSGDKTFSGQTSFTSGGANATPIVSASGAAAINYQTSGADRWGVGKGAGDGSNNFNYYNYGAAAIDASWNYATGGLVVGAATGGAKGHGTINAAAGFYDNNTLLSCYVFDAAIDGVVDPAKWHAMTPDHQISAVMELRDIEDETGEVVGSEWVEAAPARTELRLHEPMLKFVARLGTETDPLNLDAYIAHWREKRHLTSMPNERTYDPVNGQLSTGEWTQRLIETVEIQAVHIAQLHERLKVGGL